MRLLRLGCFLSVVVLLTPRSAAAQFDNCDDCDKHEDGWSYCIIGGGGVYIDCSTPTPDACTTHGYCWPWMHDVVDLTGTAVPDPSHLSRQDEVLQGGDVLRACDQAVVARQYTPDDVLRIRAESHTILIG